ncbi:MAG: SusC/RagA family TonB-linked outer membrane protein [Candidatus Pseudobacter hemicellulosilyticus]|uniref:SusC/RagA family TonB-linked outer membrane protein n=1 Tax=Candidatus Pseudobacter hemicellulosilyticus TaxID=3121375 RepID=A0AAJ6BJF9_9BACT|nr:MAG: SusC/RagA family TonB-linked outer membrane protein [Pseudobacter sp.]
MKLTALLLTAAVLQVSANSLAQDITFSAKAQPLEKVLAAVEKQTGYVFLYSKKELEQAKLVTIEARQLPLTAFLDKLFLDQPLKYAVRSKSIFLTPKPAREARPAAPASRPAAFFPITGKILTAEGRPLAGATISNLSSKQNFSSDANGRYRINANDGDILVVSYVGYHTITMGIRQSENGGATAVLSEGHMGAVLNSSEGILVTLQLTDAAMTEVVINKGYYTESRRLSTGNVSRVSSRDLENQPVVNPLQAIQGRVPGLEIVQQSGVPGSSYKLQIRGRNSINSGNDPLIIVDGILYPSQLVEGLLGPVNSIGSTLNFVNLTNIESIEVLKDADATSIYGARGANGVILITTKKGKVAAPRVDLGFTQGFGRVARKLDVLNNEQYLAMRKEAFANDGETPDEYNAPDLIYWDQDRDTDWQDLFTGGTAQYRQARASITGGTEQLQYTAGVNHRRETTVFPGDGSNRNNAVHLQLSSMPAGKRFQFSAGVNYSEDASDLPPLDFSQYILLAPNAPEPYNADGTLNWGATDVSPSTWDNPFAHLRRIFRNKTNNLLANASIGYKIADGLDFRASFGFNRLQQSQVSTYPASTIDPSWGPTPSTASFANSFTRSWNIDPQLSYEKKFNSSTLQVLVGSSFQDNVSEGNRMAGEGYVNEKLLEDINSASRVVALGTAIANYRYASLFGRVSYRYQDKYLLNITGRRDASNKFGPGKRTGNFGAVGLGWIFSEEHFVSSSLPWLSFGKLRASYGSSGNDQISNYQFVNTYSIMGTSSNNNPYQGVIGLAADNLFNPDYSWEINRKLEAGLELGFWENRINVSASFYRNESDNQLVGYALPSFTGFTNVQANLPALVRNTGWEFTLSSDNIRQKDLRWTTTANLTISRNKLVSYPDFELSGYYYQYVIGQPLDMVKQYKYHSVDPATGEFQFLKNDGSLTTMPDSEDLLASMIYTPRFFGGLTNTVTFKRFTLDFLFQFVKQKGRFALTNGGYAGAFYSGNQPTTALARWQKPGDVTNIQKFSQNYSLANYSEYSDLAYTDASYIRLKNISLAYELPEKMLRPIRMQQLKFFVEAQNLLTITSYKGRDPENQSLTNLPPLQMFTFGIQASL